MYLLSANSRATISSTAIFLSQQSRQYFSSPRGSETSFAPQRAQRVLTTALRGMASIYHLQWESQMDRPAHAGLRHLALHARDLDAMKRFYVDVLGFAVEWEPDPDNIYLSSGIDNLALHRAAVDGRREGGHIGPPLQSGVGADLRVADAGSDLRAGDAGSDLRVGDAAGDLR